MKCPVCDSKEIQKDFFSNLKDSYEMTAERFNFNKCKKCNLLFISNPVSEKEIHKLYSNNYGDNQFYKNNFFEDIRFFLINRQLDFVISKIKMEGVKLNALDIGCGQGVYSKALIRKEFNVTAVDFKIRTVKELKNLGINAIEEDIKKLKFNEKFDLIILSHVIEHLYRPEYLIKKMKKLLSPKGIIYLKTPNSEFLFLNIMTSTSLFDTPRHINIFSPNSLIKLFEKQGFETEVFNEFNLNDFVNLINKKTEFKLNPFFVIIVMLFSFPFAMITYFVKKTSRITAVIKWKQKRSL